MDKTFYEWTAWTRCPSLTSFPHMWRNIYNIKLYIFGVWNLTSIPLMGGLSLFSIHGTVTIAKSVALTWGLFTAERIFESFVGGVGTEEKQFSVRYTPQAYWDHSSSKLISWGLVFWVAPLYKYHWRAVVGLFIRLKCFIKCSQGLLLCIHCKHLILPCEEKH